MSAINSLPVGLRKLGGILGTIFQGRRDLYSTFGYTTNPSFDQCMLKYVRQDIAGRIVDAPALALWTNPPELITNKPEWDKAWNDLIVQHHLWERITRADKLAGIGKYSVILIGFNDGNTLDQPVNTTRLMNTEKKVLYLQPYSSKSATIDKYVNNVASEHFMQPEFYKIDPKADLDTMGQPKTSGYSAGAAGLGTFRVHHSRILHICENPLENEVWGSPRIERVYNILDDLLKVTGGTAETYWLTANRGLHIDVDKEVSFGPGDEEGLAAEVDEYTNNLRRVIRTRGVKVNSLGAETPDPKGVFAVLIATLSGSTGIPQRILIGSEAGQLASEQDRANWADRIDERRAEYGNPRVVIPLIKKFAQYGVLPITQDITITILWPNAFKMSPLENAQTSAQHARSATNFASAIEKMEKLRMGEPGTPDTTTPDGKVVPGKPGREGVDLGDLVTIDEARKFIGLDKPMNTIDSAADLVDPPKRGRGRPPKARTQGLAVNVTLTAQSLGLKQA